MIKGLIGANGPLAKVIEVTKGRDGLVRHAKVQLGTSRLDNKGKHVSSLTVLERPVQELVLLIEASCDNDNHQTT